MADLINGLGGTSGFGEQSMPREDDSPSRLIDLTAVFAGGLNFYGKTYTSLWLNYNGSVTFNVGTTTFTPTVISGNTSNPIIAPYWADVDTRVGSSSVTPGGTSQGTNLVWWDLDAATGTFTATWDDVGYFSKHKDLLNAFQLQIVAVGTTGDFDIHFRYETIEWTTGDKSGGTGGQGGSIAHAGYSSGNGKEFLELEQSGTTAMLGLEGLSNVEQPGHFVFEVRNGNVALFAPSADVVDFNNLTADQKKSIIAGNDKYHGLGGSDTVFLPDPGNYELILGQDKQGNNITLGWTNTSLSTFHTNSLAGDTYKVEASHGDRFFVAGAGNDTITLNGDGDNHVRAGSGETTIILNSTSGNGDNVIVGGSGKTIVTLTGPDSVKGSGLLAVVAGSGHASVTVDANVRTTIHGGADVAHTATFDLVSIDGSETFLFNGRSTVTSLRIASDTTLYVAGNSFLQASSIRNIDGTLIDPGSIELELDSTFQFGFRYDGIVTFNYGSTLIVDSLEDVGFDPAIATAEHRGLVLQDFNTAATLVLKNVNVLTGQVVSVSVGEVALKDGSTQLALRLLRKSNPSSDDAFATMIALDNFNLGGGLDNKAYFTVKASADGQDTILNLKQGNASDDALKGPQARAAHGVNGSGIKVGIISDSFANDAKAYARDVQRGVLPAGITILQDSGDGFVFAGGIDEGRAMAQIVHAIAPGAELIFHAANGPVSFASAVNALRAAGATIIVDDVGLTRAGEQLPGVQSSITSAVRTGISYVTAAGNDRPWFPVYGHAAHPDAISVAAVNVLAVPSAAFPLGDYLPAQTEGSSSAGTNGKPDVSGPDAAQSTLPLGGELNPFYGTSGSAPAVAAVVALMLQANPLLTVDPKMVRQILEATAFAFGDPSTAGAGFVQADLAVAQALIARDNFFEASSGAPPEASFSVAAAMAATPGGPQPLSAALSVPVGTAATGLTVLMLVEMGQGVVVTGTPSFTLNTGGLFTYDSALSTTAAGRLLFKYTVGAGEQAPSLAITGFTGLIEDSSGNDADFAPLFGQPTGLTINSPLKVSSVTSSEKGVVMAGETTELTVTLKGGATLDMTGGAPTLVLNDGAKAVYDVASSNPAAGKLVFDYKVGAGERTPSLTIDRIDLPTGTTLRDGKGNNADLAAAIDQTMGVQVGPAFVNALFAPIEQTALPTGQTVELTIALSQGVVVDLAKGSPSLTFSNGAIATYDAASSDPSKGTLVFDYKAAAGDAAVGNLLVSKVNLNGAVIRDAEGNPADLTGVQNSPTALTIHTPLTVASLAASKIGALNLAESLQLTITMADDLQVLVANSGGPPTLALNDGGTATYNAVLSDPANARLVFDYRVTEQAKSTANLAISQFNQNGAILFDDKGNFADLSGALNVPTGVQVIIPERSSATIAAFAAGTAEGHAGISAYSFKVTLAKALPTIETVGWAVTGSGSDPANAADFALGALPSGVLTFAAGETSKTIIVEAKGDTTVEASEGFTVTLANPTFGIQLATASDAGTIVNDDAVTSVLATNAAKAEGNGGTTGFNFTVTRAGDIAVAHSVSWSVTGSGSDPANAADFAGGVLPSGSVTFAAGEVSKTVTVAVQGDTVIEAAEAFTVTLAAPSAGLSIGMASAAGSILNDDATVSIVVVGSTAKAEGNAGATPFTFTLTRTGDSSTSHSVAWSVTGNTATPADAADFAGGVLPSGVVTFAAGQTTKTLAVDIQGDSTVESNDGFAVTLSAPSSGLTIATAAAGAVIGNDDAKISIAASDGAKAEGNSGTTSFTFTVTRSGGISVPHSASWAVSGSGVSPANAGDFAGAVLPSGVVSFAANETSKTVMVGVQGDTTGEVSEGFTVTLSDPSPGLTFGTAAASGTIQNDDAAPALDAHDDAFVTHQGKAVVATAAAGLLFNDSGAASASIVTGAGHGTLQFTSNGSFTYTPTAGFKGIDGFVYKANNGSGGTETAEAVVYVVPVSVGATTTLDLLALTADEQIAATYAAFFGRAADAAGHAFWVGEFNRGLPLQGPGALFANIASSFGVSAEAKALYPFLVNPFGANDSQISAFLQSVYNNLFNRGSDSAGLAYWTGQIKQTLQAGQFVGSVLVNIMSGAQDSANGQDITTLMGKVAVSLEYVREQTEHHMTWAGNSDRLAATTLLQAVTSAAQTVLTGIRNAEDLVAAHP